MEERETIEDIPLSRASANWQFDGDPEEPISGSGASRLRAREWRQLRDGRETEGLRGSVSNLPDRSFDRRVELQTEWQTWAL